MAEPIPSASNVDNDSENKIPDNAEDRKAAAALNILNSNNISQEPAESIAKSPSTADQEALGKAMSRLEIASGAGTKKDGSGKTDVKTDAEARKKIKIASEDIQFLVSELDLSKVKATELLRAHEGSADKAIRAFIAPAVQG